MPGRGNTADVTRDATVAPVPRLGEPFGKDAVLNRNGKSTAGPAACCELRGTACSCVKCAEEQGSKLFRKTYVIRALAIVTDGREAFVWPGA